MISQGEQHLLFSLNVTRFYDLYPHQDSTVKYSTKTRHCLLIFQHHVSQIHFKNYLRINATQRRTRGRAKIIPIKVIRDCLLQNSCHPGLNCKCDNGLGKLHRRGFIIIRIGRHTLPVGLTYIYNKVECIIASIPKADFTSDMSLQVSFPVLFLVFWGFFCLFFCFFCFVLFIFVLFCLDRACS